MVHYYWSLLCFLARESVSNTWGIEDESDVVTYFITGIGHQSVTLGTFLLSFAFGVDPAKALGYGLTFQVFHMFALLAGITKEIEMFGVRRGPIIFWVVVLGVIVSTLAI
jgi:hypothetical protein